MSGLGFVNLGFLKRAKERPSFIRGEGKNPSQKKDVVKKNAHNGC